MLVRSMPPHRKLFSNLGKVRHGNKVSRFRSRALTCHARMRCGRRRASGCRRTPGSRRIARRERGPPHGLLSKRTPTRKQGMSWIPGGRCNWIARTPWAPRGATRARVLPWLRTVVWNNASTRPADLVSWPWRRMGSGKRMLLRNGVVCFCC